MQTTSSSRSILHSRNDRLCEKKYRQGPSFQEFRAPMARSSTRRMWREIITAGYWHGEMWDKRKNGEIYAKSLVHQGHQNKDVQLIAMSHCSPTLRSAKQSEELIWKQAIFDTLTSCPTGVCSSNRLGPGGKKNLIAAIAAGPVADRPGSVQGSERHPRSRGRDTLLKEAGLPHPLLRAHIRHGSPSGGDEFTVILAEIPRERQY